MAHCARIRDKIISLMMECVRSREKISLMMKFVRSRDNVISLMTDWQEER